MIESADIKFVKATFDADKLANVIFSLSSASNSGSLFFGDIERSSQFNGIYNKNCLLSTYDDES